MEKISLVPFIAPTKLSNTPINKGSKKNNTLDLFYLKSKKEHEETSVLKADRVSKIEKYFMGRFSATDWAKIHGVFVDYNVHTANKRGTCETFLRSSSGLNGTVDTVFFDGRRVESDCDNLCVGISPSTNLKLDSVLEAQKLSKELFKIGTVTTDKYNIVVYTEDNPNDLDNFPRELYHTITFGEYPKTFVGNNLNNMLESAFKFGQMKKTDKKYVTAINKLADEYEFEGETYVREVVKAGHKFIRNGVVFDDGTALEKGSYAWFKVEPIVWKINNWDDMPKKINPNGNGTAAVIDVTAEEAICALPFFPQKVVHCKDSNVKFASLWQNSSIRGWLNGYDVNNIEYNGDPETGIFGGGNFTWYNFLKEAMTQTLRFEKDKNEKDARIINNEERELGE